MIKKVYPVFTCSIMCLLSIIGTSYQQGQEATPQIFNAQSSPLKIGLTPNKEYIRIENDSDKTVTGYRLGCVVNENEEIKDKCVFEFKHANIKPIDQVKDLVFASVFGVEQSGLYYCKQTSTMLTAIEVNFDDGSSWKLEDKNVTCNKNCSDHARPEDANN